MPVGRWGLFRAPAVLGCQLSRRKGIQNSAFRVRAWAVSLFQRERSGRFVLLRHQGRSWHFSSE